MSSEVNFNPRKHVAAIAYELWRDANPTRSDASTLGTTDPNHYLANRLAHTFQGGWDAAERHYKHMMELHTPPKHD